MSIGHNTGPQGPTRARLNTNARHAIATPNYVRSVAELVITGLPAGDVVGGDLVCLLLGYAWISPLLIAIPAAGFLVRLFMIQHDCGHGSFFCHR